MSWIERFDPPVDDEPSYGKSECDDCPCKSCPKRKSCCCCKLNEPDDEEDIWGPRGGCYY